MVSRRLRPSKRPTPCMTPWEAEARKARILAHAAPERVEQMGGEGLGEHPAGVVAPGQCGEQPCGFGSEPDHVGPGFRVGEPSAGAVFVRFFGCAPREVKDFGDPGAGERVAVCLRAAQKRERRGREPEKTGRCPERLCCVR